MRGYRGIPANAAQQGVAYGARLLMNLFEHGVRVAFFFCHVRSPGYGLGLVAHALAVGVSDLNPLAAYNSHFAVPEKDHVPRVRQQRRNIRCNEVFTRPQADNDRRAISRSNNLSAIAFSGDDNNSVNALYVL